MRFKIESKPLVEGSYWRDRETATVTSTDIERDARAKVEAYAKDKYPNDNVWVSRLMNEDLPSDITLD